MKRRVRKIANFFAFNLLFFALYLNFIHKDKQPVAIETEQAQQQSAFGGTVLVDNPEIYMQNKQAVTVAPASAAKTEDLKSETALKLSIN